MEAIEKISVYNTLFFVSMGIAVVGLALSIFFFFYFDIPTVWAMMTGRAQKDTVRRMEEQNAKTGRLRVSMSASMEKTGKTGKTDKTGKSGRTQLQQEAVSVQRPVAVVIPPAKEEIRPETEVLRTPSPETEVLGNTAPETMVLNSEALVAEECGTTSVLHPVQPDNFRFMVTETTLLIHTDEII